ncbi:MAG: hypothetical protein WCG23_13160 [bacterium]
MAKTTVLGILLRKRTITATAFQEILSRHGCNIKTRIGLHTASDNICSPDGVILLDVIGDEADINKLEQDLRNVDGADIQKMVFEV